MKNKSYALLLSFLTITLCCCQNSGKLQVLADLPSSLKENSGLAYYGGEHVWAVEDSGGKDDIYAVNFKGKIKKSFDVKNVENEDWEDLTTDLDGNLYIGDFGNNQNYRQDLVIYKLPNPENEKGDKIEAKRIQFDYPEQIAFPPKRTALNFDAEAFFHWENSLYIITKNRTRPYTGKALIYKVPDREGTHKAKLVAEFNTCDDQNSCSITSADISSDGKRIVLLSYGRLWMITDFTFDDFSKGNTKVIDLGLRTQLEAVCFKDDATILLSDERSHTMGGNLYTFRLPEN